MIAPESIFRNEEVYSFLEHTFYQLEFFFFSSRRRHTRWNCDWSSDVYSSDLHQPDQFVGRQREGIGRRTDRAGETACMAVRRRSEERRVGKECRSRWSPYH